MTDKQCHTCKHSDSYGLPDCVMPGSCGEQKSHWVALNPTHLSKTIPPDPSKHCELYKDTRDCAHVDGFLCDVRTCSSLKEYKARKLEAHLADLEAVKTRRNELEDVVNKLTADLSGALYQIKELTTECDRLKSGWEHEATVKTATLKAQLADSEKANTLLHGILIAVEESVRNGVVSFSLEEALEAYESSLKATKDNT